MSESQSGKKAHGIGPGALVGRYRIERLLGSGGMADVFYAVHEDLHRPAAIKVLRPSLAADETNLQRFLNEARAAAALIHPNIVQVYDIGRDGEVRYIAQEYVPGTNLRHFLAAEDVPRQLDSPAENNRDPDTGDRQLPIPEVLSILMQVLAALSKSAGSGIVHRDIKPENIMLTRDGEVKVADFGLARTFLGDDPKLTRAGTTLGTPMYMSPEQIQDGTVDLRSDLYSLGVTLYHMLAGRPPFIGDTQLALAMKHAQAEVPDIRQFRPGIPGSLIGLLERMLEKLPQDRFANPTEVLDYLKQHRSGDLQDHWPEQTVPLPGASISGNHSPMEATLKLQGLLQQTAGRTRPWAKWWSTVAAALLVLVSFVVGTAMTISSPFEQDEKSSRYVRGVPRQETAQKQYYYALLSDNPRASREDKWRAVEAYFPGDKDNLNRSYAGMASIQLARALHRKGDSEPAKRVLDRTITDANMDDTYQIHALIEKAIIEDEQGAAGSEERLNAAVDAALNKWRQITDESKKETLSAHISSLLQSRDAERTETRWNNSLE